MDPVLQFWRSTGGYYAKQTQARSYNLWPAKNLLEQLSCGILMVLSMLGNNNKIHLPSSLSSNQGDRPNQSLATCRSGVLQTIMQISRWIWSTSMMLEMIPKWEKRLCTPPVVQLRLHGNLLARAGLGKIFFLRLCLRNTNVDSFSLKLNKSLCGKIDKKNNSQSNLLYF